VSSRRIVEIPLPPSSFDERELQFDVLRLEDGDPVEVFVESDCRWLQGTFRVSPEGEAYIAVPPAHAFFLEDALDMGLKRTLH
jgi:hypothetical protein